MILDILVAFDQETIDVNYKELHDNGIIIADAKIKPIKPEDTKASLYAVPFTEIATELRNIFNEKYGAIGATCAVLNLNINVFEEVVQEIFGRKGQQVVEKNMEAIKLVMII